MATTTNDGSQLLDQLEHEVKGVVCQRYHVVRWSMPADYPQVEHVARIFIAYNNDPTTRPAAQGSKLQAMLPGASTNFHAALDQMEHELVRLDACDPPVVHGTNSLQATRQTRIAT